MYLYDYFTILPRIFHRAPYINLQKYDGNANMYAIMRVVMFTDAYWPRVNGVTVSVDSYSRALVKAGHRVMIICASYPDTVIPNSPAPDAETAEGPVIVRVPSFPAIISNEDRVAKINKWFWVFRQVEQFNPQVIHINTEFIIAEFGFLYARIHNLPAVYTFHTLWEEYIPNYFPRLNPRFLKFLIREVLKNILKRAYRVIVPTQQITEVVNKYRPRTHVFTLPTGIETGLFDIGPEEIAAFRDEFEMRYPKLRGKKILLFAGRVVKEKNLRFLLNILPGILAKHSDTVLLIAGGGPDLEYYKNAAAAAHVDEACVFTGYLERKVLARVYRIADVFVFPSLTDTQGLVTLEAMLSGTPVVAIGVLGTRMVMGGDNGGFMVNNDAAEFTARVLDLLENRELRRKKSEEACELALSWSIDELVKKLVVFYQSASDDYRKAHGESRNPVWKNLMDKRWWRVTNQIIRKRTISKLQLTLSRLGW